MCRANLAKSFGLLPFLSKDKKAVNWEQSAFYECVWHWLSLAWLSFFLGEKEQVCFSLYAFSMQQCQHGFPSDTVTISVSLKINGTHEIWHCFLKVLCCCFRGAAPKVGQYVQSKWKVFNNGAFINMGNFCIKWAVKKTKAREKKSAFTFHVNGLNST